MIELDLSMGNAFYESFMDITNKNLKFNRQIKTPEKSFKTTDNDSML